MYVLILHAFLLQTISMRDLFMFFLFACSSEYEVIPNSTDDGTIAQEELKEQQTTFNSYCGTLVDHPSYIQDPVSALGTVWQRPICCRENPDCSSCSFIPDFSNLKQDELDIERVPQNEVLFQANISYEDGLLTGLVPMLQLYILESSILNMTANKTFYAYTNPSTSLDREIEDFLIEYNDDTKEQGYIDTISQIEVITREYYYYGQESKGADIDLFDFGNGYYYDSGLYQKNQIFHICLKPI